ncbi:MAG: hypothetical protein ABW133_22070, partial [Polyangiaceae bacterium]
MKAHQAEDEPTETRRFSGKHGGFVPVVADAQAMILPGAPVVISWRPKTCDLCRPFRVATADHDAIAFDREGELPDSGDVARNQRGLLSSVLDAHPMIVRIAIRADRAALVPVVGELDP